MRKCPECGERLSLEARQCACGWGAPKAKAGQLFYDHECQWVANGYRCKYPAARFDAGCTTGMCVFHRAGPSGVDGARIVQESQGATRDQYLEAAKRFVYGVRDPHEELRKQLKKTGGAFSEIKLPQNPDAEAA